jgi:hypothetical protein
MALLVRSVVTGFGLALGAYLFRRLAKEIGFEDAAVAATPPAPAPAQPTQPSHA